MTQAELRLCSLLLKEHFGEIVEKVGSSLLRTGPRPLRLLVGDTALLPDQVLHGTAPGREGNLQEDEEFLINRGGRS